MIATALDNIDPRFLFLGKTGIAFQNLGIAQNPIEWGSEFMAHAGKKIAFGFVGLVCNLLGSM